MYGSQTDIHMESPQRSRTAMQVLGDANKRLGVSVVIYVLSQHHSTCLCAQINPLVDTDADQKTEHIVHIDTHRSKD